MIHPSLSTLFIWQNRIVMIGWILLFTLPLWPQGTLAVNGYRGGLRSLRVPIGAGQTFRRSTTTAQR